MKPKRTIKLRPVGNGVLSPVVIPKPKPKPKTVKAWAFARKDPYEQSTLEEPVFVFRSKAKANAERSDRILCGECVGPIVRIEVPAPKERK